MIFARGNHVDHSAAILEYRPCYVIAADSILAVGLWAKASSRMIAMV